MKWKATEEKSEEVGIWLYNVGLLVFYITKLMRGDNVILIGKRF